MMRLHSYFRSSAAYRVRIALHLKQQTFAYVPVHLVRDGGQQFAAAFTAINPQALVPVLEHDGVVLHQSLAIIEYLDECFPAPPLLPREPAMRALARSMALELACDLHPLNNLRVLKYLQAELQVADADKDRWYQHWTVLGLTALEQRLRADNLFCVGAQPTIADICLVPQVFNALRFAVDMTPYPRIAAIYSRCLALDAFAAAAPERQPDAA